MLLIFGAMETRVGEGGPVTGPAGLQERAASLERQRRWRLVPRELKGRVREDPRQHGTPAASSLSTSSSARTSDAGSHPGCAAVSL